jgi:hypothetical protein
VLEWYFYSLNVIAPCNSLQDSCSDRWKAQILHCTLIVSLGCNVLRRITLRFTLEINLQQSSISARMRILLENGLTGLPLPVTGAPPHRHLGHRRSEGSLLMALTSPDSLPTAGNASTDFLFFCLLLRLVPIIPIIRVLTLIQSEQSWIHTIS